MHLRVVNGVSVFTFRTIWCHFQPSLEEIPLSLFVCVPLWIIATISRFTLIYLTGKL